MYRKNFQYQNYALLQLSFYLYNLCFFLLNWQNFIEVLEMLKQAKFRLEAIKLFRRP